MGSMLWEAPGTTHDAPGAVPSALVPLAPSEPLPVPSPILDPQKVGWRGLEAVDPELLRVPSPPLGSLSPSPIIHSFSKAPQLQASESEAYGGASSLVTVLCSHAWPGGARGGFSSPPGGMASPSCPWTSGLQGSHQQPLGPQSVAWTVPPWPCLVLRPSDLD